MDVVVLFSSFICFPCFSNESDSESDVGSDYEYVVDNHFLYKVKKKPRTEQLTRIMVNADRSSLNVLEIERDTSSFGRPFHYSESKRRSNTVISQTGDESLDMVTLNSVKESTSKRIENGKGEHGEMGIIFPYGQHRRTGQSIVLNTTRKTEEVKAFYCLNDAIKEYNNPFDSSGSEFSDMEIQDRHSRSGTPEYCITGDNSEIDLIDQPKCMLVPVAHPLSPHNMNQFESDVWMKAHSDPSKVKESALGTKRRIEITETKNRNRSFKEAMELPEPNEHGKTLLWKILLREK